jgi:hypothetical protein
MSRSQLRLLALLAVCTVCLMSSSLLVVAYNASLFSRRVSVVRQVSPDRNLSVSNVLMNPSFETVSLATRFLHTEDEHFWMKRFAVDWEPILNPYTVDDEVAMCGERSVRVSSGFKEDKFSLTQALFLDDAIDAAVFNLRVWVRAKAITGVLNDGFAAQADFHFRNGTHSYGNAIQIAVGTYDWQPFARSWSLHGETPLSHVMIFISHADRTGDVWFDCAYAAFSATPLFGAGVPLKRFIRHTCCERREVLLPAVPVPRQSISLVAQLTVDRLPALERMASAWRGPVTAAVYVLRDANRAQLIAAVRASATLQQFVTFVLVWADGGPWAFETLGLYPINTLRNVAVNVTQSEFGLFLDVDFVVSATADEAWRAFRAAGFGERARRRRCAFIVPAFEWVNGPSTLPSTKAGLVDAVDDGVLQQVHAKKYALAHNAINYTRWLATDAAYAIRYQHEFEPYFVARIAGLPPWDERFVGYGYDKVVHVLTLAVMEFEMLVQPSLFIVHYDHKVAKWSSASSMLRLRVYQNYYTALQELRHRLGVHAFQRNIV